jgi:hypothetical protein
MQFPLVVQTDLEEFQKEWRIFSYGIHHRKINKRSDPHLEAYESLPLATPFLCIPSLMVGPPYRPIPV